MPSLKQFPDVSRGLEDGKRGRMDVGGLDSKSCYVSCDSVLESRSNVLPPAAHIAWAPFLVLQSSPDICAEMSRPEGYTPVESGSGSTPHQPASASTRSRMLQPERLNLLRQFLSYSVLGLFIAAILSMALVDHFGVAASNVPAQIPLEIDLSESESSANSLGSSLPPGG